MFGFIVQRKRISFRNIIVLKDQWFPSPTQVIFKERPMLYIFFYDLFTEGVKFCVTQVSGIQKEEAITFQSSS